MVVVVGTSVTASGPYAGGEGTDDTVSRLGLFGDDTFKTVMMVHARVAAVFGVAAVALWIFARLRGARDLFAPLTAVCVAVAITGIIGTLQYHVLDYPAWTVWLHVASVCLTWNALIWSYAGGRAQRARRRRGRAAGASARAGDRLRSRRAGARAATRLAQPLGAHDQQRHERRGDAHDARRHHGAPSGVGGATIRGRVRDGWQCWRRSVATVP